MYKKYFQRSCASSRENFNGNTYLRLFPLHRSERDSQRRRHEYTICYKLYLSATLSLFQVPYRDALLRLDTCFVGTGSARRTRIPRQSRETHASRRCISLKFSRGWRRYTMATYVRATPHARARKSRRVCSCERTCAERRNVAMSPTRLL